MQEVKYRFNIGDRVKIETPERDIYGYIMERGYDVFTTDEPTYTIKTFDLCTKCIVAKEHILTLAPRNWSPTDWEMFADYCANDVIATEAVLAARKTMSIDHVIYHDPATIIYWRNGEKTVVKCKPGETFDKTTGFAMAYLKHEFGTNFHKILKEWTSKTNLQVIDISSKAVQKANNKCGRAVENFEGITAGFEELSSVSQKFLKNINKLFGGDLVANEDVKNEEPDIPKE